MNDEGCVIEINGNEYYCPCDSVDYLIVDNGYLINTSNSTVTLYSSYPDYYVNNSGYPRITCRSNTKAYITQSYNTQGSTLQINSYEVVNRHTPINVLLMIIMIGVNVLHMFKR